MVPTIRIRHCNRATLNADGDYVLYWMIASRRLTHNFALDRALEHCRDLRKPLLIFEPLRCGYQWASDRFHRFVIDGMADNARECAQHNVRYYSYVEPRPGAGHGLLEALAARACVVVTDDYPCFFLPRMVAAAAKKLPIPLEAVDSNGLLPLRTSDRAFVRAFDFRRHLQKVLLAHLDAFPLTAPLHDAGLPTPPSVPEQITSRWPPTSAPLLEGAPGSLAVLPIDHAVKPAGMRGGHVAGYEQGKNFVEQKLPHYISQHNYPERDATSNLSPYLHFGHVSVHEIFSLIVRAENWRPAKASLRSTGARENWWNMSASTESYLDQLITWREVGYNFCAFREDYDRFDSLPAWAKATLEEHASDKRPYQYAAEELEAASTHDSLWNAAQGQLLRDGYIHNYLRMLWGKKILQWSASPQAALDALIHLNNKYSLDGRDPNSYSGIFWCLGRYDRAWGPIRPIFGAIRYMTSENTARKFPLKNYLQKYSISKTEPALSLFPNG